MITFILCVVLLLVGYMLYGKYVTKVFGPDDRQTPAYALEDGVDYVPMPTWKVFLIQLLNIAGTGPILGALGGALFGPVAYLWIVFGCIFAGAVHDYMCGMLSMRHNGASISELTGHYLGNGMRQVMRVFSVILLVMCGVVFTTGPAGLLAMLTPEKLDATFWLWVVMIYYVVATFVPIDKVIGKLYPVFGACLIIMAVGVSGSMLFSGNYVMPELWENFGNQHPAGTPIWSFMFIAIACGAISGFHATQSPMMARCCKSEKMGQKVFYGAMIAEGVIAMVWCAAGCTVYPVIKASLAEGVAIGTPTVVYAICQSTMGKIGGALALLGVIVCPISSGDTAYRSARLTIADWFKIDQGNWKKRLALTVPMLAIGAVICHIDYSIVWRYFSWSNQTLAMIALWAASMYLAQNKKNYWLTAVPATFMSAVSMTYFMAAGECMGLLWTPMGIPMSTYYPIAVVVGIVFAVAMLALFKVKIKKYESALAK
ncbi:MAG: carbon starvation protein A [Oscillospiraceae bacterium]|nr:carbon starvation protein A [Oscillospiraceae bacterium]